MAKLIELKPERVQPQRQDSDEDITLEPDDEIPELIPCAADDDDDYPTVEYHLKLSAAFATGGLRDIALRVPLQLQPTGERTGLHRGEFSLGTQLHALLRCNGHHVDRASIDSALALYTIMVSYDYTCRFQRRAEDYHEQHPGRAMNPFRHCPVDGEGYERAWSALNWDNSMYRTMPPGRRPMVLVSFFFSSLYLAALISDLIQARQIVDSFTSTVILQ
ncbi:hypothetical protein C8R46DRAFT_1234145 [Mycena filopes]|nr:hypothetical protein C8R46DRAFT_1234145 [Mycena filopes]